jgi:hypothetical protein
MYFQTTTPRTSLHFPHPSNSFKIPSRQKFNYCILNHSRTEISTSSLWNRRPPRCSPLFRNQFLRCFCAQSLFRVLGRPMWPSWSISFWTFSSTCTIIRHAASQYAITTHRYVFRRGKHASLLKVKSPTEFATSLPLLINQRPKSVCLAHPPAICCRYYKCCLHRETRRLICTNHTLSDKN